MYNKDGQTAINGHEASGDLQKDYPKEGAAVTTAYEVSRAISWFLVESSTNKAGIGADITDPDKLEQNTIEIYKAEKPSVGYGAVPFLLVRGLMLVKV